MLESFTYANTRLSGLGLINSDKQSKNALIIKNLESEVVMATDRELKLFTTSKFGAYDINSIRLVEDRGHLHKGEVKTEFKFDGDLMFSVEIKNEDGQFFCDVLRYYK